MKVIENYGSVQVSSGEFARPTAGGYICKIMDVEDVPINEQGKGDYIRIEYDIADGDFKGYYKEQFERWGSNWNASFIRSYKEKALGMFKHFTNCVEKSNAGYEWDWNEKGLIGKVVGLVLGEEEYKNSIGEIKTKLVVSQVKTVEEIKNGDFKIPAPKKLVATDNPVMNEFTPLNDIIDDLPFN
jgi:hypothetical protein